ncbi:MAG: sigma-70 family RNA polymerase sigma factor [Bacillota bacterium]
MQDQSIRRLLQQYREGSDESGQELARCMAPLVQSLAGRTVFKPSELEDYCQVGMIGLLKAARRYDLNSPVKFSTFAAAWIKGEMLVYRRRSYLPVKISRTLWEQSRVLTDSREQLAQALKREPTVSELAAVLGVAVEEVAMIMEAARPISSLEEDTPVIPDGISQEEKLIERLSLQEGIMTLSPLERQIIILRYFHEMTQAEIGQSLSLSQRQVSRLEKRILRQLRQYLQG